MRPKRNIDYTPSFYQIEPNKLPIRGESWFSSVTTFQNNFFPTYEIVYQKFAQYRKYICIEVEIALTYNRWPDAYEINTI